MHQGGRGGDHASGLGGGPRLVWADCPRCSLLLLRLSPEFIKAATRFSLRCHAWWRCMMFMRCFLTRCVVMRLD